MHVYIYLYIYVYKYIYKMAEQTNKQFPIIIVVIYILWGLFLFLGQHLFFIDCHFIETI